MSNTYLLMRILIASVDNFTIKSNKMSKDKVTNYTICRVPSQEKRKTKRKSLMELNQEIPELTKENAISLWLKFSDVLSETQ